RRAIADQRQVELVGAVAAARDQGTAAPLELELALLAVEPRVVLHGAPRRRRSPRPSSPQRGVTDAPGRCTAAAAAPACSAPRKRAAAAASIASSARSGGGFLAMRSRIPVS